MTWREVVAAYEKAYWLGAALSDVAVAPSAGGGWKDFPFPLPPRPRVLVLSPHPDDESLTGALALRLRQEQEARVAVLPMTLGSRADRRRERLDELHAACAHTGFEILPPLEPPTAPPLTGAALEHDSPRRHQILSRLAAILQEQRPALVVLPHAKDAHPTHQLCHQLAMTVIRTHCTHDSFLVAMTGFWSPLPAPNLLVGLAGDEVATLMAAVACHRGEVRRSPYHLTLPPRLMDTLRWGTERVAGPGAAAPGFLFGEVYFLEHWSGGRGQTAARGAVIPPFAVSRR